MAKAKASKMFLKLSSIHFLLEEIKQQYIKLEQGYIFDRYHDIILTQYNCAAETYKELLWMFNNNTITIEYLEEQHIDFVYTAQYVSKLVDISIELNKLPEPIYA